jgi:hypothetical protein
VAAAVVVLTIAELTSAGFSEFTRDHALVSTFITEAVLLVGVYLVIDEIIGRREARRWSDVTSLGIRALAALAHRPAEIVRSTVDEAVVEIDPAQPSGTAGYEELVTVHADEIWGWLRADDARARLFAEETRRGASRLEEAIIRWGPTLVEDPQSAELLNLLPDVVDSARSAAQAIAPVSGWLDPSRTKQDKGGIESDRTGDGRQRFEESVLEILRKVREFDRRSSA